MRYNYPGYETKYKQTWKNKITIVKLFDKFLASSKSRGGKFIIIKHE